MPEWLPAAGKCSIEGDYGSECGADVQAKLEKGWGIFRCALGHEVEDSVDWDYFELPVIFQGKTYWAFKAVGNHSPCVNCGRIVYDIPLILWGPNPSVGQVQWELHFCMDCVEAIPIRIGQRLPKGERNS